jgi:ABC-type transport system involved in multi-copper enzyme maturation permease subunit
MLALIQVSLLRLFRRQFGWVMMGASLLAVVVAVILYQLSGTQGTILVARTGTGLLWILSALLGIALPSMALSGEIVGKQTQQILSRPLPRSVYFSSRLVAAWLSGVAMVIFVFLMLALACIVLGTSQHDVLLPAAVGQIMRVVVVIALAAVFAVRETPIVAATLASGFVLVFDWNEELHRLAEAGKFGSAGPIVSAVTSVLPNFSAFQTPSVSAGSALYAVVLAAAFALLASWRFARREL